MNNEQALEKIQDLKDENLSTWEIEFVESLEEQLIGAINHNVSRLILTDNQERKLDEVYRRHFD